MARVFQTICKKTGEPHPKWRFEYFDWTGKRRKATGTTDEEETRITATRIEDDHRQIRLGYRPAPKSYDAAKKRPFEEVADEYLAWGKAQGGHGGRPWDDEHAKKRKASIGR